MMGGHTGVVSWSLQLKNRTKRLSALLHISTNAFAKLLKEQSPLFTASDPTTVHSRSLKLVGKQFPSPLFLGWKPI